MKDYILLIEDDGNDFIKINEIFKPYEDIFEIVPTQEEYDKVRYLLKSGGIYPYLQDILQPRRFRQQKQERRPQTGSAYRQIRNHPRYL